jgi:hypothetical protein
MGRHRDGFCGRIPTSQWQVSVYHCSRQILQGNTLHTLGTSVYGHICRAGILQLGGEAPWNPKLDSK